MNERVAAMAGIVPNEFDQTLPAGAYVYVTGTRDGGGAQQIFTKLYRDHSNEVTGCPAVEDRWTNGAVWFNPPSQGGTGHDQANAITITNTDPRLYRDARALVQGWTMLANGNIDFVALKYDTDLQLTGNKERKWVRVEDPAMPSVHRTDIPAAIVHRMIGEFMNYFPAGWTNQSSNLEDFYTLRFQEVSEGP